MNETQWPGGQNPPPYGVPPQEPPYQNAETSAKVLSILSYVGLLWLVGFFVAKDDARVRFHVNQGILLSLLNLALAIAVGILSGVLSVALSVPFHHIGFFGGIAAAAGGLLRLVRNAVCLVFMIIGIIHAAQGRQEPLPFIGPLFTFVK